MQDLISFVVPVYNAEEYVADCVESIEKQTYKNVELLLIDDGSTDESFRECKRLEDKYKNIKVYHQDNQGVSVARNVGTAEATGDWICYLDPDDWIEADYAETLLKEAKKNNADICICDTFLNYSDREVETHHLPGDMLVFNDTVRTNFQIQLIAKKLSEIQPNSGDLMGAPWGKIFKRSFIRDNNLSYVVGLKRSQDCIFNLYALQKAERVVYVSQCLHHYRYNPDSVTNKYSSGTVQVVEHYLQELNKFLRLYKKGTIFKRAEAVKIVTSLYKCFRLDTFNKKNLLSKKEQIVNAKKLIERSPYKDAIKQVRLRDMSFQEAVFTLCLKFKFMYMIRFLIAVREKIRKG